MDTLLNYCCLIPAEDKNKIEILCPDSCLAEWLSSRYKELAEYFSDYNCIIIKVRGVILNVIPVYEILHKVRFIDVVSSVVVLNENALIIAKTERDFAILCRLGKGYSIINIRRITNDEVSIITIGFSDRRITLKGYCEPED